MKSDDLQKRPRVRNNHDKKDLGNYIFLPLICYLFLLSLMFLCTYAFLTLLVVICWTKRHHLHIIIYILSLSLRNHHHHHYLTSSLSKHHLNVIMKGIIKGIIRIRKAIAEIKIESGMGEIGTGKVGMIEKERKMVVGTGILVTLVLEHRSPSKFSRNLIYSLISLICSLRTVLQPLVLLLCQSQFHLVCK